MYTLATIGIGMNPLLLDVGPVVVSWHGLFTFIAVAVAVYLTVRWGSREGMVADVVYSVAVWSIIGGIVGARVIHIIDFWGEFYAADPIRVIYVWQGGIAIYGAILGGFVGGSLYLIIRNSDRFLTLWGRFFRFMGEPHKTTLPRPRSPGRRYRASGVISHGHWQDRRRNQRGAFRQSHLFAVGSRLYARKQPRAGPSGFPPRQWATSCCSTLFFWPSSGRYATDYGRGACSSCCTEAYTLRAGSSSASCG